MRRGGKVTWSEPAAFASAECLEAFDRLLIGKELTPEQTKFAWEWFERGCLFRTLSSVPPHTPATAEQVCDAARLTAQQPTPTDDELFAAYWKDQERTNFYAHGPAQIATGLRNVWFAAIKFRR